MVYTCLFDLGVWMGILSFCNRCFPSPGVGCGFPPVWGPGPSIGGLGAHTPGILPRGRSWGGKVPRHEAGCDAPNLQVCGSDVGEQWFMGAWREAWGCQSLRCDRRNATAKVRWAECDLSWGEILESAGAVFFSWSGAGALFWCDSRRSVGSGAGALFWCDSRRSVGSGAGALFRCDSRRSVGGGAGAPSGATCERRSLRCYRPSRCSLGFS